MALVRGCSFPEALLYDVPRHTWYRPEPDGTVRAGLTPVAIALAREVLVLTPKRVGRDFEKDQSIGTIESAKSVFAIRAAFAGTVVAVNEAAIRRPTLVNTDFYGEGWMLLARPAAADWRQGLVTGADTAPTLEAWMDEQGFPGCGGA